MMAWDVRLARRGWESLSATQKCLTPSSGQLGRHQGFRSGDKSSQNCVLEGSTGLYQGWPDGGWERQPGRQCVDLG